MNCFRVNETGAFQRENPEKGRPPAGWNPVGVCGFNRKTKPMQEHIKERYAPCIESRLTSEPVPKSLTAHQSLIQRVDSFLARQAIRPLQRPSSEEPSADELAALKRVMEALR